MRGLGEKEDGKSFCSACVFEVQIVWKVVIAGGAFERKFSILYMVASHSCHSQMVTIETEARQMDKFLLYCNLGFQKFDFRHPAVVKSLK